MDNRYLLAGLAVLLILVFGCAGGGPSTRTQPAQPSVQSNVQLGDADITPQPAPSDNITLSDEGVPGPDNSTDVGTMAPPGNVSAGSMPSDQDLALYNQSDQDLISQEDIIQPS